MGALRLICASLALLCLTAGCSVQHKAGFCSIANPIRPSAETVVAMTDAEVRTVLAHNRKGAALCGWKP